MAQGYRLLFIHATWPLIASALFLVGFVVYNLIDIYNMTLRGFLFSFFIIVVLIFGIYFFVNRGTDEPSYFLRPDDSPVLKPISISGKLACLPHRDKTGPQTEECAIGVMDEEGVFYGLLGMRQEDLIDGTLSTNSFVDVSGILDSTRATDPALWDRYDVFGTIMVSNISNTSFASTSPETSDQVGLFSYPDLALDPLPAIIFTPKLVLEHRSALNKKTIPLRGVVVFTLLGEEACPPDRGACARPRIYIGESLDPNRDKAYDIMVLLSEGDSTSYVIGDSAQVNGTVFGTRTSLYLEKTY